MVNLVHKYYSSTNLEDNSVGASDLSATLGKGFVVLPLTDCRELSGGAFINIAGAGGLLASNSTPTLTFSNGGARVTWVGGNADPIYWQVASPVDFDRTAATTVNLVMSMDSTTDTPTVACAFVEAMTNSSVGGNTSTVSGTTPTQKVVTITASALSAPTAAWGITVTPGTHATDALRLDSAWIEYTRK